MRLITAVIQPHALESVTDALREHGVAGLTISEVAGYGRQGGHTEVYRGAEYRIDTIPKIKLEVLAEDADEPALVEVIVRAARTGRIGDGKVWTSEVGSVVRVRTGEEGASAL
ncbi:P-II family nitrogen regulator [Brachybacterium huguangmaarense]|uniref:Nitrogen regulatory protein P-II n=1 Tax=Brachybacterium huguangmaarense TaxID=1652028 RepID=A0ABY6FX30_9MICO|nr:P-II family nitrogen regulator [Brachybacterium huguangmaarense]UYG15479.1 P-II family nitrogen regulator [Brachybacterium huguangmaarense]